MKSRRLAAREQMAGTHVLSTYREVVYEILVDGMAQPLCLEVLHCLLLRGDVSAPNSQRGNSEIDAREQTCQTSPLVSLLLLFL